MQKLAGNCQTTTELINCIGIYCMFCKVILYYGYYYYLIICYFLMISVRFVLSYMYNGESLSLPFCTRC